MRKAFLAFAGLPLLALTLSLAGCGEPSTEMSATEQKNFKGGPRPSNVNEMMQKSIEDFRKKHPAQNGTPQPTPDKGSWK